MMLKSKYRETRYQWSVNSEHILLLKKIMLVKSTIEHIDHG